MKEIKLNSIDDEFFDLVRNVMTDDEFWKWVRSWKDPETIMDQVENWDSKDKMNTLIEFGYVIK